MVSSRAPALITSQLVPVKSEVLVVAMFSVTERFHSLTQGRIKFNSFTCFIVVLGMQYPGAVMGEGLLLPDQNMVIHFYQFHMNKSLFPYPLCKSLLNH